MAERIRLWRFCRDNFNGLFKSLISHELLVAKLECSGLDELSLKIMLDYLSNRKQRTKIGSSFGLTHPLVSHKVQSLGRFYLIYLLRACYTQRYSENIQNCSIF